MLIGISGYAGSGKDTTGEALRYLIARANHNIHQDAKFSTEVRYTESQWLIKKFADPLRQVAQILTGLPLDYLYSEEFKRAELGAEWTKTFQTFECDEHNRDGYTDRPMTGREFLQLLGTDAIRANLHTNTWVNALMSGYKNKWADLNLLRQFHNETPLEEYPNWIITDMRFPNELAAVKQRGGITIRVNKEFYKLEDGYHKWSDTVAFSGYASLIPVNRTKEEALRLFRENVAEGRHESETALDGAEFDFTINNNGTLEQLLAKLEPVKHVIYGKSNVQASGDNGYGVSRLR